MVYNKVYLIKVNLRNKMLPIEPIRPVSVNGASHRIKKIIIGVILVPVILLAMLMILIFVANVLERSKNIQQGNYTGNKTTATSADNSYTGERQKLIEGLGNQSFGATEPKVTIVEFADFACPYCKQSYTALRSISTLYKDTVKVIFRDWPGHTNSISLALAAYCAGEQNKFWEMHDLLYLNQSDTFGADKNDLANLANELNIYNTQFQTCFDTQKYLPYIKKNVADSETLGVKGTPTWFINGTKIEGSLTSQDLENIIKSYVSK
jgi:protein-disulfide isomerase